MIYQSRERRGLLVLSNQIIEIILLLVVCDLKIWSKCTRYRRSHRMCSEKKVFLEISQNSQVNACALVSFLIKLQAEACNFVKKETLVQVFSREFWEISKNAFSTEHLWATSSEGKQVKHCN